MSINTNLWGWPQWALLIWLFLSLIITGANHGKPVKEKTYNAFWAYTRWALFMFFLIAGGFFR